MRYVSLMVPLGRKPGRNDLAFTVATREELPVLFLIQNNGYAISVPQNAQTISQVHRIAAGFGLPSYHVDGTWYESRDFAALRGEDWPLSFSVYTDARAGQGQKSAAFRLYRQAIDVAEAARRREQQRAEEVRERARQSRQNATAAGAEQDATALCTEAGAELSARAYDCPPEDTRSCGGNRLGLGLARRPLVAGFRGGFDRTCRHDGVMVRP